MKLSDFLEDVGRPVAYYPSMARMLGDMKEAIFLCQMAYWKGKETYEDGWLYKSAEQIEEETALTYREQTGARDGLKAKGLLEDWYSRTEHRVYFRVDWDAVNGLWEQFIQNEHLTKCKMPPKQLTKGEMPPAKKSDGIPPKRVSLKGIPDTTPQNTKEKDSLIEKIESHAISVFDTPLKWHLKMKRRLEDESISIISADGKIIIRGLSEKLGQFTEAEFWTSHYQKSFANTGLDLEFRE